MVEATAGIPNRALFKPAEVCEIAQLPPYVLRSWEAEFPDLGFARNGSSSRMYRRADVEQVLRIKHLLFVEGLTLAGIRRRIEEESAPVADDVPIKELLGRNARERLAAVRQGLRSLLDLLSGSGSTEAKPAVRLVARRAVPRAHAARSNSRRTAGHRRRGVSTKTQKRRTKH